LQEYGEIVKIAAHQHNVYMAYVLTNVIQNFCWWA